ncbi:conserved hypothetical protein [Ricinus communis]|uniref:HTH tetR-type domain-containing protein n=1 Tax=Ricinus communis TaxID=3988 RepID=B9TER0_RICCO|nr:conserved hypothetical protein [Ricinus communis]
MQTKEKPAKKGTIPAKGGPSPKELAVVRQKHVLKIATSEFFERGFDGTTIDRIAVLAEASKATIYKRYRSKEELFEAVVLEVASNIATHPVKFDESDIEGSLRAWGKAAYKTSTSRQAVELLRLIIAEGAKQPELVRHIREIYIERSIGELIQFFSLLRKHNRIIDTDPAELAISFSLNVLGGFRHLLGVSETPGAVSKRIENAVVIFSQGCMRNSR